MTISLNESLPPNPLKGEALRAFSTNGKVPFRGFRGHDLGKSQEGSYKLVN